MLALQANAHEQAAFLSGTLLLCPLLVLPLFGFVVARLGLPLPVKATIIGLLTVGGPEIFGILAVVCLGKENLLVIKDKILAVLRLI